MKRASPDVRRAAALYRKFREKPATRARKISVAIPRALAVMGHVSAIEYETTHGGTAQGYRHVFRAGSKPLLCAGTGNGQLYLLRGRFRVTSRGIVDLKSNGREE